MAYWYMEANYPIRIAVSAGLALAILEILLEKALTKHVHTLSKFNFYLIAVLGAISLIGDQGIWFKLQPFFTGLFLGGFLIFSQWRGKGVLAEMMESLQGKQLSSEIINTLELHMAILMLCYGIFMGVVAFTLSTDAWLFFKTIGFYIVFGIFMVFEIVFMRWKMKKIIQRQQHFESFRKFRP